jgi:NADH dehydrogenase
LIQRNEAPQPFRFRNRGNTAVIGLPAAVFDFGRWQMKGRLAWFLWALVHVYLLINFEKRLLVSIQWLCRYLTEGRGARIISEATTARGRLLPFRLRTVTRGCSPQTNPERMIQ